MPAASSKWVMSKRKDRRNSGFGEKKEEAVAEAAPVAEKALEFPVQGPIYTGGKDQSTYSRVVPMVESYSPPPPAVPPRVPTKPAEVPPRSQPPSLEFVGSQPTADGRDPRWNQDRRDRERRYSPLRPYNEGKSIDRSNSTGRDSTGRQERDAAKSESGRLMNELMERYERKELDTRIAHTEELKRLADEKATMQAGFEDSLRQQKVRLAGMQANHTNEMRKERKERDQQIATIKADYDQRHAALQEKTLSQCRGLEEDIKSLQNHYENKLRQQEASHEAHLQDVNGESHVQVSKMTHDIAILHERLDQLAAEADKSKVEGRIHQAKIADLRKENENLKSTVASVNQEIENLRNSYEANLAAQTEYYKKREASLVEEVKISKEKLGAELTNLRGEAERERLMLQDQAQYREQAVIKEMETREANFRAHEAQLTAEHKERLAKATAELRQRIQSLEADLVDNGDDLRPSLGSGALQTRYRELKLKVERITEPFNLEIVSSPDGNFDQLDPTEFLAREGKSQLRFLLRSTCWSIIIDGFFSSPFGFGAFGREEGRKMLLNVYSTWQRLFDPTFTGFINAPELKDQEDFEPFYNDKFANWWRSATFQTIQSVVLPSRRDSQVGKASESVDQGSSQGQQGIAKIFADNVERVKSNILDVITKACNVPRVSEVIEHEVNGMVRLASLLAVEFGSHGAKICFGMPKSGDTVQIGTEFVDCEDGDANRGKLETVQLAVAPSLFIIGDGRKDLTTASCLYPGEIYPQRS